MCFIANSCRKGFVPGRKFGTSPLGRGTSVTLYLKAEDKENGLDDFSDRWVISRIVRRYSDFVSYPIILKAEKDRAPAEQKLIFSSPSAARSASMSRTTLSVSTWP